MLSANCGPTPVACQLVSTHIAPASPTAMQLTARPQPARGASARVSKSNTLQPGSHGRYRRAPAHPARRAHLRSRA
jgi:hypothetical protein